MATCYAGCHARVSQGGRCVNMDLIAEACVGYRKSVIMALVVTRQLAFCGLACLLPHRTTLLDLTATADTSLCVLERVLSVTLCLLQFSVPKASPRQPFINHPAREVYCTVSFESTTLTEAENVARQYIPCCVVWGCCAFVRRLMCSTNLVSKNFINFSERSLGVKSEAEP